MGVYKKQPKKISRLIISDIEKLMFYYRQKYITVFYGFIRCNKVYLGLDLVPYFGEEALGVGIVPSDTVYLRVEIVVKIRVGFYQSVIGTRNLSIIDKDESYAAHTAGVSVGGFEI